MDALVEEINKLDDELYQVRYHQKDFSKRQELWDTIKKNKKLLELSTRITKDKFGERDTFLSTAIVECILIDYENVDKELYQSLVDKIYSNTELARIVLDGASNGGYSFLLYTLFNDSLELTDEQKAFVLEEAMNKVGTTKYNEQIDDYEQELDRKDITDDIDVIAPEIGLIGAKTWNIYMAGMFASMNPNQAHGTGEFDVRYHILKNHNFANKIEKLVYDFFADDADYDRIIDYWEWNIVNLALREEDNEPMVYVDEVLFISDKEVYDRLPHEQAIEVIAEINFIKRLHEIREPKYRHIREYEDTPAQKILS